MSFKHCTRRAIALLLPSIFSIQAEAVNLVQNGSFEIATNLAANSTLAPGATNLTGWEIFGSGNLIWCNSATYCARPAAEGTYSLDLTGLTNTFPYAGVSQAIATTVGTKYDLTFALAGRSDSTPVSVKVLAGSLAQTFSNASANWASQSLSFIAAASETPISISGLSAGLSGLIIQIDNVQVQASPVPEPASWALLVAGVFVVGAALQLSARQNN